MGRVQRQTPRRTKIVATLGPATATAEAVVALARAGMDAARFNFSHGTRDEHAERAEFVRAAQAAVGRPLALIADLQGPKIRVGELSEPMRLDSGSTVTVVGEDSMNGHKDELPVSPTVLGDVLKPGHEVLIDDGRLRLLVERVESGRATCAVVVRRCRDVAQGGERPRRPDSDPLADAQGPRRSRVRARAPRASTTSRSRSCARPPTCATCRT